MSSTEVKWDARCRAASHRPHVEDHVDASKLVHRLLEQLFDSVLVIDVLCDDEGLSSRCSRLFSRAELGGLGELGLSTARENNLVSVPVQGD